MKETCPECGSDLKYVSSPLSRICTNGACDFQEEPGERKPASELLIKGTKEVKI